jgi:hypothetical protein
MFGCVWIGSGADHGNKLHADIATLYNLVSIHKPPWNIRKIGLNYAIGSSMPQILCDCIAFLFF